MPQVLNSGRAFVGFLLSASSPALHTHPAQYHCRHLYKNSLPSPLPFSNGALSIIATCRRHFVKVADNLRTTYVLPPPSPSTLQRTVCFVRSMFARGNSVLDHRPATAVFCSWRLVLRMLSHFCMWSLHSDIAQR